VIDWPESIAGTLGAIAPADRAPLTVIIAAFDVTTREGEPLSVNWSSKDQVPDVDKGPVETVGLSPGIQVNGFPKLPKLASSGPFFSHWQVLGMVPPLKEVVVDSVELSPALMVVGLADITGAVRLGFTVTIIGFDVTTIGGDPVSVS
jgi:hypothetical protein